MMLNRLLRFFRPRRFRPVYGNRVLDAFRKAGWI